MCKVVNQYKERFDVYIGRPSKWGNPFSYKEGTLAKYKVKDRNESVDSFRKYITEGEGKHLLNDLHELKGKTLGCFCKPLKCHGDVLKELIDNLQN
jgi:hypothetical protein